MSTQDADTVWVLLKKRGEGDSTVMAVYPNLAALCDRVARIAKSNPQYPLRAQKNWHWVIGPEEDEGFFGHEPVYLRGVETKFYPEQIDGSIA